MLMNSMLVNHIVANVGLQVAHTDFKKQGDCP